MDSPLKAATPLTAVAVSVPPRVAPAGLLASWMVTLPSKPVSMLPSESSTAKLVVKPLLAETLPGRIDHRELASRAGHHVERAGRCPRQARADSQQRVSDAGLVDRDTGESRHAVDRRS